MTDKDDILAALAQVKDPDLGRDIVALGFVKDLRVCGTHAAFTLELTTPACPVRETLKEEARRAVLSVSGITQVEVTLTAQVRPSRRPADTLLPHVKHLIAIGSGKGGVGKSTISSNVAVALAKLGAKVGLMDADIYGPSIPRLMGAYETEQTQQGRLFPALAHGVKVISMGMLQPKGEAVLWRGPMLAKMIDEFLGNVEWGELDYLIIDLPPGTGDVSLSLCQKVPLSGAAIVSTPQDLAFEIAQKALQLFQKLRTPVLGLIENMSGFTCSHCGTHEDIFGLGNTETQARALGLPFLGKVPLTHDLCRYSDQGLPIVTAAPDSPAAQALLHVAENLVAEVSRLALGESAQRPCPQKVALSLDQRQLQIIWNDGEPTRFEAVDLRYACRCARCVSETSGKRTLVRSDISADLRVLAADQVGHYALRLRFSDQHDQGLYTYDYLRELMTYA